MRANNYKIANNYSEFILNGKDICDAPALMEQITPLDIYKIAYNTGFIEGRQFSKQLLEEADLQTAKTNIAPLKLITKNFKD